MDAASLAIAVKAAKDVAAKVAREVSKGMVPEKGDAGRNGVDGKNGKDGRDGRDGVDGRDGKDGRDGADGKDGQDGSSSRWYLTQGAPDVELGEDDDFALDGNNSDIYHKEEGEWEFVVHLKAEMPMFQPPRAYSPEQIKDHAMTPRVRYTAISTTTEEIDEVIVCTAELTVTLHTPPTNEVQRPKRIKRAGPGDVTVETVDGDGYILNVNYQAVDVQWTGTEWISL